MEVIILPDEDAVGELGAKYVAAQVRKKPDSVLGVATGSSPVGIYQALGRMVQAGELSLAQCEAFLLDEYVGLPADHPERYSNFIKKELVDITDLDANRVHGLDGLAEDLDKECKDYEKKIKDAGGVDLQILGIGSDGHIAFNEPGSSLSSRTRIKTLIPQTRQDNARFFGNDIDKVPIQALTQGVGTILEARHLLLVAMGIGKSQAVHEIIEGGVSAMWTGSALQLHKNATVILDEAAASRLQLATYYRWAYEKKPDWQRP